MDVVANLAAQYRRFAGEARDSATFAGWAGAIADDAEVLAWIGSLPPAKQQPNLVLAAARWHGVAAPGPYEDLRRALLDDDGSLRATVLGRSTQTNEVGRLAALVPAIAQVAQGGPVALIEVGASAGLCLYPDRWSYRWDTEDGVVEAGRGPTLTARVHGPAPLPREPVQVAYRGGIDLNPLDVRDVDAAAWLENLVWPEHHDRRARLHDALTIAQADPPHLVAGDLLDDLPGLVAEASEHGPVVVFHSAVIAYLEPEDRLRFDQTVRALVTDGACRWVSNEAPTVLPSVTRTADEATDEPHFVLGVDGEAVALTQPHGRWLRWLRP